MAPPNDSREKDGDDECALIQGEESAEEGGGRGSGPAAAEREAQLDLQLFPLR